MKIHPLRLLAFAFFFGSLVNAQTVDDAQLKQVIIFGCHSVRAPVATNMQLDAFSTQNVLDFHVPAGYLTPNGEVIETILGGYTGCGSPRKDY